jgi:DNA-directed RNA polymerase subunit RPC12/RpoP
MPVIWECSRCSNTVEIGNVNPAGWSREMRIGGSRILCPKCSEKELSKDNKILRKSIKHSKELDW